MQRRDFCKTLLTIPFLNFVNYNIKPKLPWHGWYVVKGESKDRSICISNGFNSQEDAFVFKELMNKSNLFNCDISSVVGEVLDGSMFNLLKIIKSKRTLGEAAASDLFNRHNLFPKLDKVFNEFIKENCKHLNDECYYLDELLELDMIANRPIH